MRKYNYLKYLCVVVAMLTAGLTANAQQIETSVYLNGAFPVGSFRHAYEASPNGINSFVPMERTTIATSAAVGLAATGRCGVWLDIGFGQLLPYVEAGLVWNGTRSSIRDIYDNNSLNDSARAIPTTPTYFNIPVMLGLKYRYPITDIIRPYAEFGIGYDIMIITGNGYSTASQITDMWYTYKLDGKFCWMVGAGTYLGDFVSVGLFYTGLGNHRIHYTATTSSTVNAPEDYSAQKRNIGQLGVRVGFHF